MSPKDDNWPQIRQDLVDRVGGLEVQQAHTNEQMKAIIERIDRHGESQKKMTSDMSQFLSDFYKAMNGNDKDKGYFQRVRDLEVAENIREKKRDGLIKIAVGTATLAVGSIVLYIGRAFFLFIKEMIGKI